MKLTLNVEKIEIERSRLGITKTELAQRMGFSKQRLDYILKNKLIIHAYSFGKVFCLDGKDLIL